MSAFPGLIRTKELQKCSYDGPPRFLEPSPPPIDRKVRMQTVDSPYFTSQGSCEKAKVSSALREKAVGTRIDHTAPTSTPRLDSRNISVSPPRLKRSSDRVSSEPSGTDVLLAFEHPDLAVRSSSVQASHLSARDARAVTDTDLLHASNQKPRRGPNDDNSSSFSGETRLSGSTSSRTKEHTCRECKFKGHANLPLIKCSTCTNRFHANEKCINPKFCDVKNEEEFRCRQCVSKGRTRAETPLPLPQAEDVPTLVLTSNALAPSSDAITKPPSLLDVSRPDWHLEPEADPQSHQPGHKTNDRNAQGGPNEGTSTAQPSDMLKKLDPFNARSVDMSVVPKEPAAMRETSSSLLHRLPPANNLLDSYRPNPTAPPMATRGFDSYRPSERSRPPPVYMVKERETFLRHASKDERDRYLRQNRKAICKEITCHHQLVNDCRHGDKCMYSHEDTGSYFPSPPRPSKKWTCFFWLDHTGCRDREEDCLFSHYDTGIYAGPRGLVSTKHVTCFWFHKDGACRKGADCLFAHYETGILAEDPGVPRRERNNRLHRPNSPVRRTSESWRPKDSTNKTAQPLVSSSPPPVRDTPLSPVEPSESESEEYEPPSVRATPEPDLSTESHVRSANPLPQPFIESLPPAELETAPTASHGKGPIDKIELEALGSSTPSTSSKESMPDTTFTEEPTVAAAISVTVPKQYARRTGGVKIHRITGSRRRIRASLGLEHAQNISDDTTEPTKREVQGAPTQPHCVVQPVETSGPHPRKPASSTLEPSEDTSGDKAGPEKGDVGVAPTQPHSMLQPVGIRDPRRRKPASSTLEPSQDISSDKAGHAKGEVQVALTQPHSIFQPVENPNLLKCQVCQKLILVNQAASHKCQRTVTEQTGCSQKPSVYPETSEKSGVTDRSPAPHPLVQCLSINDQVKQAKEPDVTTTSDNMEHIFPRTPTDSSVPESTFHGSRRTASGSEANAMFISSKKRKMGLPLVPRASTSINSPSNVQAPGPLSAKRNKTDTPSLSILDLTELEALQKEFDWNEESLSDDQATILKLLRAKKRKKVDREQRRAREEAAEAAKEEAEEAAERERRQARLLAKKEERRKKFEAELAAELAEEHAQEERDREVLKERLREQLAQERRRRPNGDVESAGASNSTTSPSTTWQGSMTQSAHSSLRDTTVTTPGHDYLRQSSGEHPAEIQEVERRFNGIFSVIPSNLAAHTTQASGALSTSRVQDGTGKQISILEDRPVLEFTSSDEEGIKHDDKSTENPTMYSRPGLSRSPCEPCRRRGIECRHYSKPLESVVAQPQTSSSYSSVPIPARQYMESNRSSLLEAGSREPESKGEDAQKHQPRNQTCKSCKKSKRKCYHDPLTAEVDSVRGEPPPRKRQRVTPDSFRSESAPLKSTTPQLSALEPMFSSLVAGISATKTATSASAQAPLAGAPGFSTADPATTISGNDNTTEADRFLNHQVSLNTDLSPTSQENHIPLSCGKCGILPPKRLRRFSLSDHLLCDRCYNYRSKNNTDYPINNQGGSQDSAVDDSFADNASLSKEDENAGIGFTFYLGKNNKGLTALCSYCGWKAAQNSTKMRRHRRDCSKERKSRSKTKGKAPLADDFSNAQSLQQTVVASGQHQVTREASNSPSIAAGLKAAKGLASEAVARGSTSAPNGIAPPEIQALFCQPLPSLVEINEAAKGAVPWTTDVHDKDNTGPRLVQSKMHNDEEKAAVVARMRAQGIEVISVDGSESDSDSSWSGSEVCESSSYPFQPVPLVKSARYEEESDPRRWVDEVEDQKAKTFDFEAAQRKIKARPGLKENVKALENCKKTGKLLAISDWRSRIRKYGSLHRETERDPGPQKKGTYIREVADRTKLTIPRGFDDHEIMKEEVEGTMQEFLGLPRQMKYDLMDSNRLVAARTLAFSDAAGRGRVPDRDKFPVGKGA